jgi:4-diphosphocytidyl-2-C-methyl-D-erythritol kinase
LPEQWYLVVNPNCQVATADIFNDPELTRDSLPITMHTFLAGDNRNDCESVVRRRFPAVAAALDWLGKEARLTGTGACVYVPFSDAVAANTVLERIPTAWQGFVARSCNRSPLLNRLD